MENINTNSDKDLFNFLKDELRIFEETCEEFNGIYCYVNKSINNKINFRKKIPGPGPCS